MNVYHDKASLEKALKSLRNGGTIGLVPTMGALHQGHLALIKQANQENYFTVVSIFVNPTQFNNPNDLKHYPRTLDSDIALIKASIPENVLVFAPSTEEMYGNGLNSEHYDFHGLENQMEGAMRPGHFDGVGTIVSKLFEIVKPNNAYFGEKDFQQLQIIRKLVATKQMPITIVGCPIVREESGLAKSSRNQLLTEEQKEQASIIYEVLTEVALQFSKKDPATIHQFVEEKFIKHPLFKLDYFEISDEETLHPIKEYQEGQKYRAFIAVYAGEVRLIDNMHLN